MIGRALRLIGSLTVATGETLVDGASLIVDPGDYISIPPRTMRRLLLTFDDSIQGKIPEILGDEREARIETLVRLLQGTSPHHVNELLDALQEALARLAENDGKRSFREVGE